MSRSSRRRRLQGAAFGGHDEAGRGAGEVAVSGIPDRSQFGDGRHLTESIEVAFEGLAVGVFGELAGAAEFGIGTPWRPSSPPPFRHLGMCPPTRSCGGVLYPGCPPSPALSSSKWPSPAPPPRRPPQRRPLPHPRRRRPPISPTPAFLPAGTSPPSPSRSAAWPLAPSRSADAD